MADILGLIDLVPANVAGQVFPEHPVSITKQNSSDPVVLYKIDSAEPSTSIPDLLGFGWDGADTSIQVMSRTGSGTAQKVALNSLVFPKPTVDNTTVHLCEVYCPPNGSTVYWRIENLGSAGIASGSLSSSLPATSTFLAPRIQLSVGGVSSAISFHFMQMHLMSEL